MAAETYWRIRRALASARYRLSHFKIPRHFLDTGSLFIHIPKAAGMSVTLALYGLEVGHRSYRDYSSIDRVALAKLFTFSVVRNPWDRFVSAYYFLAKGGMKSHPADRRFNDSVVSKYRDINHFAVDWLNPKNVMCYHHFVPQVWYLKNSAGVVDLNFLARFESLDRDFRTIADALGFKGSLPKVNSTGHPRHNEVLSAEAMDAVGKVYAEDVALLGYDPAVPTATGTRF